MSISQTTNCPFCRIAEEGLPPYGLYEDEHCFVILDRESLGFGHCMVIPRRHVVQLFELPDDAYVACLDVARRLAPILQEAAQMAAVAFVSFGSGLAHAHLHLVPHTDIAVLLNPAAYIRNLSDDELIETATQLRERVRSLLE